MRRVTILAALLLLPVFPLRAETTPGAPKAQVSLIPSVSSIAPGETFDVAVWFELEPGWHIYWQNSGDAGQSPAIMWTLPEGFRASDLKFPAPKKHVSPGDIVTNILKGTPAILASITAPSSIEGSSARISAKVISFVCSEQCVREEAEVDFHLPVVADKTEVQPANEDVFARARRALPKVESKVVQVTPRVPASPLVPGSKFEIDLKVDIAKGHHIQSNAPTQPSLIPAEVFVHRISGVRFLRPSFPAAKIRKDKYLGDLSEFGGTITVQVPAEIDPAREPGGFTFGGVFSYQACNDTGNCLPPEAIGFELPLIVASASEIGKAGAVVKPAGDLPEPVPPAQAAVAAPNPVAPPVATQGLEGYLKRLGLAGLLLGCFVYGLFINATPCVLPLLSIKVLGFVQQAHESRRRTLVLGLAFGAGVVLFFVALGLLASSGHNILQFPLAVIILGGVVLALALSMLGVYTLHVPTSATALDARIQNEGPMASFAKGALAPVLGFACTGPLLAGIFGWATQQPRQTAVLAFAFAGLGMASPYMLLGANPRWLSFLPRPGMWMITFERLMGFLLLAMVVWLIHPLTAQIGVVGMEWTLVVYVMVAMSCWLLGKIQITMPAGQRWRYRGLAAMIVTASTTLVYGWVYPLDEAAARTKEENEAILTCNNDAYASNDHVDWRLWTPQAVQEVVHAGRIAFVDFTAAYCTVCKVNKKIAIETPEFVEKLRKLNAVAFKADFTNSDDNIASALIQFKGAAIVPLNLIYAPGRPERPLVLEPNLTKEYLLSKLDEAQALSTRSASSAAILGGP